MMTKIEYQIEVNNPKIHISDCYGIIEDNLACICLDVNRYVYVSWSSITLDDYPMVGIYFTDSIVSEVHQPEFDLEISFPTLKGYSVHCGGSGKSLPISFVKKDIT